MPGFLVDTSVWLELAASSSASPKTWMDAYLAAFATLDSDFLRFESAGLDLRLLTE